MYLGSVVKRLLLMLGLTLALTVGGAGVAQEVKISRQLWTEAEAFRVVGASDFLFALEKSSTPEANLKFAELAGILWPGRASPEAWSGFFRHALITFIAGGYEAETVLFQHPWADVVLLTSWKKTDKNGTWRINDLGMAMGSVLRGARPPYPVGREWVALKSYAPVAVGQLNAKTTHVITGFESGRTDNPLAALDEDAILSMMAGAGLQLQEHQVSLLPLLINQPGLSRAMRFAWNEVMAAAQNGSLASVLPANAPVAALGKIDRAFWNTLEPVGYFEKDNTAVAMFSSWRNPDLYVAIKYQGTEEAGKITDINVYSFSAFLKKVAK